MPFNVPMPKAGADVVEAKLVRWLKKEGDQIGRGDALAEIETDKVNMEVEAFNPGTLFQIIAAEGATLPVGEPIAVMLKPGEEPPADGAPAPAAGAATSGATSVAQPAMAEAPPDQPIQETPAPAPTGGAPAPSAGPATAAAGATSVATATATLPPAPSNGHGGDTRIKASPLARRLAQEHNLDLRQINGRGPGGRVVKDDVEAAIQAGSAVLTAPGVAPAAAPTPVPAPAPAPAPLAAAAVPAGPLPAGATIKELSRIQLTTGRRLAESKQQAPHFYLTVEVDMAEALKLRATLNQQAAGSVKISVNDLVIKAAVWALGRHPNLNASFRDGHLVIFDQVNISVAVAIEEGLVSPVIPDAGRKSLGQIARESRAMIERARAGKLRADDLSEGTFTVSNLGMYDIDNFIAIINPPQAAILAVGAVREIPVVRNGQIVPGQIMKASISVDHRAADGAQGAQFLSDVRKALETPLLMAL